MLRVKDLDNPSNFGIDPQATTEEIIEAYSNEINFLKDKLHRRNMQIKDLKEAIRDKTASIEDIYDIINDEKIDADETISKISAIVSDN